IYYFGADNVLITSLTTTGLNGGITGLAARGASPARLYALSGDNLPTYFLPVSHSLFAWDAVNPPDAEGLQVDQVTATSARFRGLVNPNGGPTTWWFAYRRVGGTTWSTGPSPAGSAGSGSEAVP